MSSQADNQIQQVSNTTKPFKKDTDGHYGTGNNSPEFWEDFLGQYDFTLYPEFNDLILDNKDLLKGPVIELACGRYPASDVLIGDKKLRILVDFIDLQSQVNNQTRKDNPILVKQNLREYSQSNNTELDRVVEGLDNIGSIIISSGINYFPWKQSIMKLLPKMIKGSCISIFTVISSVKSPTFEMDEENKPKSPQEVLDFLEENGFEISKTLDYEAPNRESIGVIAVKK